MPRYATERRSPGAQTRPDQSIACLAPLDLAFTFPTCSALLCSALLAVSLNLACVETSMPSDSTGSCLSSPSKNQKLDRLARFQLHLRRSRFFSQVQIKFNPLDWLTSAGNPTRWIGFFPAGPECVGAQIWQVRSASQPSPPASQTYAGLT